MKPEKTVLGVFLVLIVPALLLDMFQYLVLWPTYVIDATFHPLGVLVFYTTSTLEAISIFLLTWMMASVTTRLKSALFMGAMTFGALWADTILNRILASIVMGVPITELATYAGWPYFLGSITLAYFAGWMIPWLWDIDYHQVTGRFKAVKRWANPTGY